MKSKNPRRHGRPSPRGKGFALSLPCADLHADDGPGGRPASRSSRSSGNPFNPKPDRKVLQLCGQVRRVLTCALTDGYGDPVLQSITVDAVTPAPDATRLRVTVLAPADVGRAAVERLGRARGRLRREVAEAIVRKRAPELVFHVIPADAGHVGGGEGVAP